MSKRKKTLSPLTKREVTDDNFAHCLGLAGMCFSWLDNLEEGHRVQHNDRNMIQIPAEVALAFIKLHARYEGSLAESLQEKLRAI